MRRPSEDHYDSAADLAVLCTDEVRVLLEEGQQQGYLDGAHIDDALRDVDLTPEQLEEIRGVFADLGIDVIESEGGAAEPEPVAEEAAPKLDLSVKSTTNNPVRMYFRRDGQGAAAHRRRRGVRWPSAVERRDMDAKRKLTEAGSWCPSPDRHGTRPSRCSTSSRKATSGSCARSRSSDYRGLRVLHVRDMVDQVRP